MPSTHIAAEKDQIAKTVLMPGDPLRAKFIAKTFLKDATLVNEVRGMLGYTGTYDGKPVTVMGSGMGMPSVGIYSWELYTQFDVENIIRVGTAGSYAEELAVFDVLVVTGAYSESSYAKVQNGYTGDITYPGEALTNQLRKSAAAQGKKVVEGFVHSTDVFYQDQPKDLAIPYWQHLRQTKNALAVEMETFALFHNAAATGKQAAAVVSISDSFVHPAGNTDAKTREQGFTAMMEIALGAIE